MAPNMFNGLLITGMVVRWHVMPMLLMLLFNNFLLMNAHCTHGEKKKQNARPRIA